MINDRNHLCLFLHRSLHVDHLLVRIHLWNLHIRRGHALAQPSIKSFIGFQLFGFAFLVNLDYLSCSGKGSNQSQDDQQKGVKELHFEFFL